MVHRKDLWTHDTCLVCQSIHSTESEKAKHEKEEIHKNKIVVYDFLSKELSCLSPIDKVSVLYQRYYRASAAVGGLDCICELNFSWSDIPFWACTICNVAGRTCESADIHLYSSFHKRNYISEYDPDRYAILLRAQEKSSKNKQSLLEHEAILAILNKSNGLMQPDVYELKEKDREWAYQKLGLAEEEQTSSLNYVVEDISDTHQIVLCNICGETFTSYNKEELFRQSWSTHLSTKLHQRCQFMLALIREDNLEECTGLPPGCDARQESKFEKDVNGIDEASYGPTVGLEFLIMFNGSDESFCQLCFCSISNKNITRHFSSEYHIERFMKRDGPSKLLNSEYLKIEEILEILIFCYGEKPITTHKYFRSTKQFPLLLKNYALPERQTIIAYNMEQIDLGHNLQAIWCEDCKEYVQISEPESWNIHIFDEPHFEQAARKSLLYIDGDGLVSGSTKLDEFQRGSPPTWEDQFSITLGLLTIQDHCEFGLEFIINDKLKKKFYCTCCLIECDEQDAQMFSFHARSLQHLTKIMNSMNKKTMITLAFRFPDLNNRKPLILDYLKHHKMDNRQKQQISIYDPVMACKLNCLGSLPKKLLHLASIEPEKRMEFVDDEIASNEDGQDIFVPINTVMRLCKLEVKSMEKESMVIRCEECQQTFTTTQSELEMHLTEHLLSSNHWERKKLFDENKFDDNYRLATKVSKIKATPFQQMATKKVTWKWNDKKACYEFVYAQLGIGDIAERRYFGEAQKPDMFCFLCAQSFKANRIDLEQHIRSFKHIFHYMEKYQPNIIGELNSELTKEELNIVAKHKNIRRLFAKALKNQENKKPEDIPIYDFEERNCEYADVKKALMEDMEAQSAPIEQKNVIKIPSLDDVGDQSKLLDLDAIRLYGEESKQTLLELYKHYKKIIETDKEEQQRLDEPLKLINLDKMKRQLLSVVHFDGLMETEIPPQQQGNTATTNGPGNSTNPSDLPTDQNPSSVPTASIEEITNPTPKSHTNRARSRPPAPPRKSSPSRSPPKRSRSRSRPRGGRRSPSSRSPSVRHSRGHSRSPYSKKRGRSRSSHRWRSSRSPSRHRRDRSPPVRTRSRTRPPGEERRQSEDRSTEKTTTTPSTSSTVTSPNKREPIVYTSYAKRLADLKASLLAKGGSKHILTGDPNLYVFQRKGKGINKAKVAEYVSKEAETSKNKTDELPKVQQPHPSNAHEGGFFNYIPPTPPIYTQKKIGGAYDAGYLDKMYPHLLRSDVSPPRGNLADLTSERVRQASSAEYSPTKSNRHHSTSYKRPSTKSRSPEERGRKVVKHHSHQNSSDNDQKRTEKRKKKRGDSKHSSDDKSNDRPSSSSSGDSNSLERTIKKQQLMNRFKGQQKEMTKKKIQMQIPKELPAPLPAFRLQALKRKKAQMIAAKKLLKSQGKVKEEEVEEAAMEAISGPEDEDEIVETSAVESSPEKQPPPPPPPWPTPMVGQRNSKWDETPPTTAKYVLVDGKFVPANNLATPPQTTLTTTPPIIGTPQDVTKTVAVSIEPPRLVIPTVTQQAQNVLSSMAASTSAFTAQQIRINQLLTSISNATPQTSKNMPSSLASTTTTSVVNLTQSAIPSATILQPQPSNLIGIGTVPPPHHPPILGANPLPASLLGTLTSALGVRPSFSTPPLSTVPPPKLDQPPPPFMNQFQPQQQSANMIMENKMRYYAQALDKIDNIKDFIEYMWREGYDPIPLTDPPLLFNEVLKKQRGMIGANTLYQIICYGRPELETYYCGMCNHWTTVSEMFAHLRAPMHQLNYMFRNYKKYHQRAMEEQDEHTRDLLLQKFALKIWELENCGQCTNRIRCILNENAIGKFWPDYSNFIDHSWKIMDDDDIEFLNINQPNSALSTMPVGPKNDPIPQQRPSGSEIKSKHDERHHQRTERNDKESSSSSSRRRSRSPRKHSSRSRSRARRHRSRSPSPTSTKSNKEKRNAKEKNTKIVEKQKEMDSQTKRRAIAATVELQQEYSKNGDYITGEVFFATCQEFGIQPDDVMQTSMLREAAAAFNVDLNSAYSRVIKGAGGGIHQREINQPAGTSSQPTQSQPMAVGQANQENPQQQQPQFNLQSMGVDPSKLRAIDQRMLQSFLTKANSAVNLFGIQQPQGTDDKNLAPPKKQRLEPQDICLNESLAPGNYVYPSYNEVEEQQPHGGGMPSPMDVDSNINRLTYAFGHPPPQMMNQQRPPPLMDSSGAEFTLAVQASMHNKQMGSTVPGGEAMLLPKHPKAFVRQTPPPQGMGTGTPPPGMNNGRRPPQPWMGGERNMMAPGPPHQQQTGRPQHFTPSSNSNMHEKPPPMMDFAEDVNDFTGWPSPTKQQFGGPPQQQQMPMSNQRPPPPPHSSPSQQFTPVRPQMPHQQSQSPAYHRSNNPIDASSSSTFSNILGAGNTPPVNAIPPRLSTPTTPQKQMNPNVQRLAKKVGDDWNSLDQLFDLDGLIGFNATGAGSSSQGNVQQPKPKKGPLEEKKK